MKFTAAGDHDEYGTVYVADGYRIVHKIAGFGIASAVAWCVKSDKHDRLGEYTGPNGLNMAMDACRAHAKAAE